MGWWDNLWLNEGFASWMQVKAAEHFHPQWQTWLNDNSQKQYAMSLDARRTSHPIQQPVADQSEAMTAFDGITYSKGQALIRMIESYLGENVFRDGIRRYMAAHAYGNATTADLWQALGAAAGKPVTGIAGSFTEQDGVPLILAETRCSENTQRLALRQDRFVIAPGDAAKALPPRSWQVPVALGAVGTTLPAQVLLQGTAEIAAGSCGEPIKVNLGDSGYYRVEYGANDRAALTKSLARMAVEDRLNFVADGWALVQGGRADLAFYLTLVEAIGADDQRAVWNLAINSLTTLDRVARDQPGRPALQAYARKILRPVFDRLGWDDRGSDDDKLLRANLIRTLGDLGDADILAEAKRRFAGFVQDPQQLPNALRDPVIHLAGISADRATFDTLIALARKSTVTFERVRYYNAAASARDPALARAALALTLTGELPSTIVGDVIYTVASRGEQAEMAWDFVQKNFAALSLRQGPSFADAFVPNFMTSFSDVAHAAELKSFAPAQATSGGRVMTARSVETILISADLNARALPAMDRWIREHGGR
jgi:aminopeptidase N